MGINKIINKLKVYIVLKLAGSIYNAETTIGKNTLPVFGSNPRNLTIELPRRILNPERIFIGDNVSLGPGSFLYANTDYPTTWMQHPSIQPPQQHFDSKIIIGNRVTATAGLQISAQSEIKIEDDVMFASNIHINDAFHGFETANKPYKCQQLFRIAPICIKSGCWIGQNVVLFPGVTIGENTIIGANSVVSKSIPPKSIAVGMPARVVKMWNDDSNSWLSVANDEKEYPK
jgi:acetyltransferase-like isoleucine patch superfamily enzyme